MQMCAHSPTRNVVPDRRVLFSKTDRSPVTFRKSAALGCSLGSAADYGAADCILAREKLKTSDRVGRFHRSKFAANLSRVEVSLPARAGFRRNGRAARRTDRPNTFDNDEFPRL